MSRSINQFVADWHVWWVDGESPVLKHAYQLSTAEMRRSRHSASVRVTGKEASVCMNDLLMCDQYMGMAAPIMKSRLGER